tara:strand:+ start:11329 stop:11520 length:192 start_codon:yes stop_codon:yes gene_type:complete
MINYIIQFISIFFCLAGYTVCFSALTLVAITTPSWGASLMMVAIIIFISGQFIDVLIDELNKL